MDKTMEEIKWWHRIKLPDGRITPGICYHGPDEDQSWITNRFGLPVDLTEKTVLDIGAANGLFSFEAEKRGARRVVALEGFTDTGNSSVIEAFDYAHAAFNSKVELIHRDFFEFTPPFLFDFVLFYGVLYHVLDPLGALRKLYDATAVMGEVLIETAVMNWFDEKPLLQFEPGWDNDPTNYFYPNYRWIEQAAKFVGFYHVEQVFVASDISRATARLIK